MFIKEEGIYSICEKEEPPEVISSETVDPQSSVGKMGQPVQHPVDVSSTQLPKVATRYCCFAHAAPSQSSK